MPPVFGPSVRPRLHLGLPVFGHLSAGLSLDLSTPAVASMWRPLFAHRIHLGLTVFGQTTPDESPGSLGTTIEPSITWFVGHLIRRASDSSGTTIDSRLHLGLTVFGQTGLAAVNSDVPHGPGLLHVLNLRSLTGPCLLLVPAAAAACLTCGPAPDRICY